MNDSRSRRASTKLVTAATKSAVLQTSPQFAKKFASTVEKVNKSERKTARDTSQKEVVKEKNAKKTIIPEENKRKVVNNRKPTEVGASSKRKLSPEKITKKRKKTKPNTENEEEAEDEKDVNSSMRRSRRETTRISTLATLNSSNAADVETKSRESSVESSKSVLNPTSIQEEKNSPAKLSEPKSQKKDAKVKKKPKNSPQPSVKDRSTNGEAKISKERKKTQKPVAVLSPASGGARRSARSSTAISTLASNNAASQVPFMVEESTSEEEEEKDHEDESEETVDKVETTPKKRGRGRPKAEVTPLSPNNPFAAITREYKEQRKIAAKLKRKRKSSLSPDDRPRLLTEAENNKLFDSLFEGDSPSPPPPSKVVKQKSRSSNSSKKQLHTDAAHKTKVASPKSVVLESNKKPPPPLQETKPQSIKKPEIKPASTKKESVQAETTTNNVKNVPPNSLKWLQSPSPLKNSPAPRVIAPWRQICDTKGPAKNKEKAGDSDVYEFAGPGEVGAEQGWGRAKPEPDTPERKMFMISKHGAYSGHLAGLKRKLEQKREETGEAEAVSPGGEDTRNGSPPHKPGPGSPMIDPSQRVGHGAPRPSGKARLGSQRLGGAIKGSLTGPGSHQLSLTSLASDYNIVAAVSKYHNNIIPASSPDIPRVFGLPSETEPGQNQPEKGRRKSFLLSKIFSKPKDQDSEDSDNADNGIPAEKEEKSVKEVKVKQKKQTSTSRRPLRNSSSRNVSLREASSESEGSADKEESERTNTSIVCTSCHK